jgi:hypothetical protein
MPEAVTPAAKDSLVRARLVVPLRSFPAEDTVELREAVAAGMRLPAFHPPISTAHVGSDGSVWLRREDDGTAGWRWIVLNRDGEPRGTVVLPRTMTLEASDSERVWVVERDDLGIPWVVRYRLGP